MPSSRDKLIERAISAAKEFKNLDFKREWDISTAGGWCEVLKDIVAMANSGDGIIVFDVNDDASASLADTSPLQPRAG